MYQLGLSTATPEVPRMSLTLGANRWASKVVVVLQLAAWSAVGIVLLQKGVSSLQKSTNIKNVTMLNYTENVASLTMKKIADEDLTELSKKDEQKRNIENLNENISRDWGVLPVEQLDSSLTANHLSSVSKSSNDKKIIWNPEKNLYQDFMKLKKNLNDRDDKEEFDDTTDELKSSLASRDETTAGYYSSAITTEKYNIGDKVESTLETRRKLKISKFNGGGAAAAAVAMVAVGAVMLILGPAIIILRAIDERRQERRFQKLFGQDDLPPSYEQATLMDEAPRYSTLSLNTLACSQSARTSSPDPGICEV